MPYIAVSRKILAFAHRNSPYTDEEALWIRSPFRTVEARLHPWWRCCSKGTVRSAEWGTLGCGGADIVTGDEVRAVGVVDKRVEGVEIRQGQIASRGSRIGGRGDDGSAGVARLDGVG